MSDVVGAQVSVPSGATPAATRIIPAESSGVEVLRLVNRDGTNSVFLGPASVAASGANAGLEVKAGDAVPPFSLPPEAALYAFPAAGTPRVDVLYVVAD